MIRRLKLFSVAVAVLFAGSVLTPAMSLAASVDPQTGDACAGLNALQGGATKDSKTCAGNGQSTLNSIIRFVVETLSWVLGIAAVIMVLLSGFKYITAGGDSGKISSAKNTLIYALIGLIVAVLAQTLIHFVLNASTRAVTPCPSNHNISIGDAKCK